MANVQHSQILLLALVVFASQCMQTSGMPPLKIEVSSTNDLADLAIMDTIIHANKDILDHENIFNVDMMMPPGHKNSRRKRREVQNQLWPKSKDGLVYIPYVISDYLGSTRMQNIDEAKERYRLKTCIRLVPRKNETDYVNIIYGSGCWSYVGRQGGAQSMSIGSNCDRMGSVIHEFMHALGFIHEHQRNDRDENIEIVWANVDSSRFNQFEKPELGTTHVYGSPYDIESVMHYGSTAFQRAYGLTTIQPRSGVNGASMGQRTGFSKIDLQQINRRYKCTNYEPSVRPLNGEYEMKQVTYKIRAGSAPKAFETECAARQHMCFLPLFKSMCPC